MPQIKLIIYMIESIKNLVTRPNSRVHYGLTAPVPIGKHRETKYLHIIHGTLLNYCFTPIQNILKNSLGRVVVPALHMKSTLQYSTGLLQTQPRSPLDLPRFLPLGSI